MGILIELVITVICLVYVFVKLAVAAQWYIKIAISAVASFVWFCIVDFRILAELSFLAFWAKFFLAFWAKFLIVGVLVLAISAIDSLISVIRFVFLTFKARGDLSSESWSKTFVKVVNREEYNARCRRVRH